MFVNIVKMNGVLISLFSSRIVAVCDEMGAVLQRAAFSPNIKDRLDFSCAVFDNNGHLVAQAAHIPVHLGSMAYAMADIIESINWQPQDMLILNDPFLGGTHLPDVTLVMPVFHNKRLIAFVANRAHHANIGSDSPGSMPLSTHIDEEGLFISPRLLIKQGVMDEVFLQQLHTAFLRSEATQDETGAQGDLAAQISANLAGHTRLLHLVAELGERAYQQSIEHLNQYGEAIASRMLAAIPNGVYRFSDILDDDGVGTKNIAIVAAVTISDVHAHVDFKGTAKQSPGNINCPKSVAAAAVYYVFRCLMPEYTPNCAGSFRPLSFHAPKGSLLNATKPAAVAAGNVETSTRLVDVLCGALAQAIPERIPAASYGTMNNVAMGCRQAGHSWDYYETIGGGMGAGAHGGGLDGVQAHMTNTLNTPIESVEMHFPLRIEVYRLREGSGGQGARSGGCGLIRTFRFLEATEVTLLTERRVSAPWGLNGGTAALPGENILDERVLPAKTSFTAQAGQCLTIKTPGGGGWGKGDK